jgi:glycosyltransferase 2 family protein
LNGRPRAAGDAVLRKLLTWVSGPVLAGLFLWLAFRGVSLSQLGSHLRGASWPLVGLAMASALVHLALRSLRWRTLLDPVRPRLPFDALMSAVVVGYMASLLPGRVGEVLRPILLSRQTGTPLAPAIASVGVERVVLDVLGILGCGGLALVLPVRLTAIGTAADPALLATLRVWGAALFLLAIAGLVVAVLVARHREPVTHWLEAASSRTSSGVARKIMGLFASLLPGLSAFATARGVLLLVAETAAVWGVIALGNWLGIRGAGVDIPLLGAMILIPILAVGIGIPTPGGTGTFHFAMKIGLTQIFGVAADAALGAALLVHAMTWLPVLAGGAFYVARGGLRRREPEADTAGPATEAAR